MDTVQIIILAGEIVGGFLGMIVVALQYVKPKDHKIWTQAKTSDKVRH